MFDVGGPEVMLILFIFLLLFGANKMPELARGIGKTIREFKKAASGVEEEVRRAMEEEPAKPAPKPAGTIQQPPPEKPSPPPSPPPAAD
jgi:sec-independent protein translocase protein TatA